MPYADPERARQRARERYQANKAVILEKNRQWVEGHKEQRAEYLKEYQKEYREEHKMEIREQSAENYAQNKDEIKERNKKYAESPAGRLSAKKRSIRRSRKLRMEILTKLGGKCITCGFNDPRALQIDHINGGGKADRGRFKSLYQFYLYLLSLPDETLKKNYQVLCANHNRIKAYEECGWKWEI